MGNVWVSFVIANRRKPFFLGVMRKRWSDSHKMSLKGITPRVLLCFAKGAFVPQDDRNKRKSRNQIPLTPFLKGEPSQRHTGREPLLLPCLFFIFLLCLFYLFCPFHLFYLFLLFPTPPIIHIPPSGMLGYIHKSTRSIWKWTIRIISETRET